MPIIQAIILGIIQGFTEFLPVSSSGHLIFLPKLFGWADQGLAFDTVIHLGTLVAVVVYFRKRLWMVLKSFLGGMGNPEKLRLGAGGEWGTSHKKLGWLLLLSIVPAGIAGLLFDSLIEEKLRATWIIGVNFIVWGIILFIAETVNRKLIIDHRSLEQVNWENSLLIGCAQAIALIPGTSRSGITMTAGLFSKLDKKSAAEFSFLMSVPIIALAGGMQLIEMVRNGFETITFGVLGFGFFTSVISGLLAIWGLMKIIQRWSFMPFVVYRIVMGIIILVWLV